MNENDEKTVGYAESDAGDGKRTPRPVPDARIRHFAARLEEAMRGKSGRAVAAAAGLSEGVLRSYLRGKTYPSLDRLAALADALEVSPVWLATGERVEPPQNDAVRDIQLDYLGDQAAADRRNEREKAVLTRYRETTAEVQRLKMEVGFEPGSLWGSVIHELMFAHRLSSDGARRILETLKSQATPADDETQP